MQPHFFSKIFKLCYCLFVTVFIPFSFAQQVELPPGVVRLQSDATDVPAALSAAQKQAGGAAKFWLGYRFDLREDINFHHVYIHDEGGITISRSGWNFYDDDEDLETVTLRALSDLGDEKAKEQLKQKRVQFVRDNFDDWGFFLLVDASTFRVEKMKLFSLSTRRKFENLPAFWADKITTPASFNFLRNISIDLKYNKSVFEPAFFVLSMHALPQVAPHLKDVAGHDERVDARETAAFWLGQIPREESLAALLDIYPREKNREVKEKIIFSISQHQSDKVLGHLARIAETDPDSGMREKAIFWIGQQKSEASLNFLEKMLAGSQSAKVKEQVVFAISQHGNEKAVDLLIDAAEHNPDRQVREKAIFWLGQRAGERTLGALGGIVANDEETEIKEKAVFAISQHSNKQEAADMLIEIAKNNSNPEVRRKAMFWLGQMGDARAVDFFKDILTK